MSDTGREVSRAYGALDDMAAPYPARISYLIDPDGTVACVWATVEPGRHASDVLAALG